MSVKLEIITTETPRPDQHHRGGQSHGDYTLGVSVSQGLIPVDGAVNTEQGDVLCYITYEQSIFILLHTKPACLFRYWIYDEYLTPLL